MRVCVCVNAKQREIAREACQHIKHRYANGYEVN